MSISTKNPTITLAISKDSQQAQVTTDTLNDAPIPEITLGKSYDFRGKAEQSKRKTEIATSTSFTNVLGTTTQSGSTVFHVSITSPQQGAHLVSAYPFITGTGFPNTL